MATLMGTPSPLAQQVESREATAVHMWLAQPQAHVLIRELENARDAFARTAGAHLRQGEYDKAMYAQGQSDGVAAMLDHILEARGG